MIWIVAGFGVLVMGLGVVGLVRPQSLLDLVESAWKSPAALHFAIGVRLALGIALIVAAPESRFPQTIRVLGIVALAAAAAGALLGRERLTAFVAWWTEQSPGFVRGWSIVALAFGGFLISAAT
jgi:hypothetical protein